MNAKPSMGRLGNGCSTTRARLSLAFVVSSGGDVSLDAQNASRRACFKYAIGVFALVNHPGENTGAKAHMGKENAGQLCS